MTRLPARALVRLSLLALGVCLAVGLALWSLAGTVPGNLDDAFITLVYARRLSTDGALYWNAADGPVDGFTSMLDVLLKAGLWSAFSEDGLLLAWCAAMFFHVLVVLLACGFAYRFHRDRPHGVAIALLTSVVVASSSALADGSAYLLETPMAVALAVAACAWFATDRLQRWSTCIPWTVLLVGLFLVRPEGQAIVVGLLALHLWRAWPGAAARLDRARTLVPPATLVSFAIGYYTWRLQTFGSWAPNTYHAKTSDNRMNEVRDGIDYVAEFASSTGVEGLVVVAILVGPALLWLGRHRLDSPLETLALVGGAWGAAAMVVLAGGDCYPGGRFLALPVVLGAIALAWLATRRKPIRRAAIAVLALWCATGLYDQTRGVDARKAAIRGWPARDGRYACEREVARRLAALVGSDGAVMQTDWQRLAYFEPSLHVIDLHGLNDAAIARSAWPGPLRYGKFDYAEALLIRAPIWVWGWRLGSSMPMAAVPMKDLLGNPLAYETFVGHDTPHEHHEALAETYLPASVPQCNAFFNVLVRRDWAQRAIAAGLLVGDGHGAPLVLSSPT
jgi:hypothetical protein